MKTFFRVSVLGLLMFAVVAVSNQTAVAQSDPKTELYERFTNNYDGDLAQRKIAVAAGKEFIRLYKDSADDKAIVDYLKDAVPTIEQGIIDEEKDIAEAAAAKKLANDRAKRFAAFDSAIKAKNWGTLFSVGDAILKDQPDFYDVAIVLATAGFDLAVEKNNTYNDEAVKHAQFAIKGLNSGKKAKTKDCTGGYYSYTSKTYPNCMRNSLGWMNYYVGWIKYYRQENKDEAIPYFFEATKYDSDTRENPVTYQSIGAWYIAKTTKITEKRNAVLEERNSETKIEEPDEAKIAQLDSRIDQMIAMERGYADRAIDAYSRAYSLVPVKDRGADYGKRLFGTLQSLYKFRYDKPEMQSDTKINMNVSMIKTKQMPDPAGSDVQPVIDPKTDAKPVTTAPNSPKSTTGASRSRTVSN